MNSLKGGSRTKLKHSELLWTGVSRQWLGKQTSYLHQVWTGSQDTVINQTEKSTWPYKVKEENWIRFKVSILPLVDLQLYTSGVFLCLTQNLLWNRKRKRSFSINRCVKVSCLSINTCGIIIWFLPGLKISKILPLMKNSTEHITTCHLFNKTKPKC